jgi:hypothetical protein
MDAPPGADLGPQAEYREGRRADERIAAEAIPRRPDDEARLPPARHLECPRCGEIISRAAVECKYCGAQVSREPAQRGWGKGGAHRPHRAGVLLAMTVVSYFVCAPLAAVALVVALHDLREMRAGRMDPSGEAMTWIALILAVIPTVILAFVIFLAAVILLSAPR